MKQVPDIRGVHGATASPTPRRGLFAAIVLLALTASSPAQASYSEGFATLVVLYVGVLVGAGAFVVSLLLCIFGIFRHRVVFATYFLLASAGAAFVLLIACLDTHGVPFLIAASAALALWAIVVAPAAMQYWHHRRQRHIELAKQRWARFIRSGVDEVNQRTPSG